MVCVRLTSRHRSDRREWATEHVNWRRKEWSNVLFSDKSRFSIHLDNKRIFIWRDRGSRNNPAFMHESVRFGGGGVLVYGGISIDGRTDLYIIRDGRLTAHRYRDEIFRTIAVPYAAAIGDAFILMDDNCRSHRTNLVEDFLFGEGIVRMESPACSPDMNPIEQVWDALGRRVAGRQPPPQTLQELEIALLEEWDRIPHLVVNSLIDSLPQSYLNFGAIGFVIGHEITHGFDDRGRQFDKDGNNINWWEPETDLTFRDRAQCIVDQYGNYSINEVGLQVNGINTQGENIADNGGIKEAFRAYLQWIRDHGAEDFLPGIKYSPTQLFWISAANVWCGKYRPEVLKLRIMTGSHSPAPYR
ncbi:neprilysin-2 [Trichonephila clavipes]|nr:neprilysin-2 [Trichonephila clavipes]